MPAYVAFILIPPSSGAM